jgi:hypothetical protein
MTLFNRIGKELRASCGRVIVMLGQPVFSTTEADEQVRHPSIAYSVSKWHFQILHF